MKALVLRTDGDIRVEDIADELNALQHAVDGHIETLTLRDGAVMIVDEEGRFNGKAVNGMASALMGICIVGTAVIVGSDGDGFCDVPEQYLHLLRCDLEREHPTKEKDRPADTEAVTEE